MIHNKKMLHIKFRFYTLNYIVFTYNQKLYQLEHCEKKRTKLFREIKEIKVGGSIGYRINRNFYTKKKLNTLSYKAPEYLSIQRAIICPF